LLQAQKQHPIKQHSLQKKQPPEFLPCLWVAVNKFYLGFTTPGLIMCLVCIIGGILTCGLACIPIGIIALIEGIMNLTKSDDEFYQLYAVEKKGWF